MKLTIEESDYLERILGRAENLYGNSWKRILSKTAMPMPKKGFSQLKAFQNLNIGEEEKIIEQLKQKNILRVRKEETDIEREGDFENKYSDKSNYFIGLNPDKLEKLRQQLAQAD